MSSSFRLRVWRIFVGLLAWSTSGWAQSVNLVALDWTTLAGCPGSDVVEQRVQELAGSVTRRKPLRAKGEVNAAATGVHLHLETQDAGQTFVRDVQLRTCEQAAETAALVLAMALRAELVAPASVVPEALASEQAQSAVAPAPVTPVPSVSAPPLPPPTAPVLPPPPLPATASGPPTKAAQPASEPQSGLTLVVQPTPSEPNPLGQADVSPRVASKPDSGEASTAPRVLSVGAGGAVAWGLIPKALWAVTASGGLTFDSWRIEVAGAFAPSQRVTLANDATRGGEFVLWHAGLRGCYVASLSPAVAPVRALACVGGEGGQLRGTGFGTGWSEEGVAPWWALNAGLGALLAVTSRLKAVLRVELLAPLWRDSFVLQNAEDSAGEVARPGPAIGRVGLGVEGVF